MNLDVRPSLGEENDPDAVHLPALIEYETEPDQLLTEIQQAIDEVAELDARSHHARRRAILLLTRFFKLAYIDESHEFRDKLNEVIRGGLEKDDSYNVHKKNKRQALLDTLKSTILLTAKNPHEQGTTYANCMSHLLDDYENAEIELDSRGIEGCADEWKSQAECNTENDVPELSNEEIVEEANAHLWSLPAIANLNSDSVLPIEMGISKFVALCQQDEDSGDTQIDLLEQVEFDWRDAKDALERRSKNTIGGILSNAIFLADRFVGKLEHLTCQIITGDCTTDLILKQNGRTKKPAKRVQVKLDQALIGLDCSSRYSIGSNDLIRLKDAFDKSALCCEWRIECRREKVIEEEVNKYFLVMSVGDRRSEFALNDEHHASTDHKIEVEKCPEATFEVTRSGFRTIAEHAAGIEDKSVIDLSNLRSLDFKLSGSGPFNVPVKWIKSLRPFVNRFELPVVSLGKTDAVLIVTIQSKNQTYQVYFREDE